MPIGISPEHLELHRTMERWTEARSPREVARAALDSPDEVLPPFWDELASQGWLGVHVPEDCGGQGFGFAEVAVILEELARVIAPGPVLPTMLAAAVLSGLPDPGQRKELLSPIVDGSVPAAVALPGAGSLEGTRGSDGSIEVQGRLRPVLGASLAKAILAPVKLTSPEGDAPEAASEETWCLLPVGESTTVEPLASLDLTRRVAEVKVERALVSREHQLEGISSAQVRNLALCMALAECTGGARWCLEVATAHAIDRRQFGRPIGQFQAVKHRLADMLVSVEQVASMAWDAAQALDSNDRDQSTLSAVLGAAIALDAYAQCAKSCIQVLGGMGFTWEHDAHLHLRRSISMRQLLGDGAAFRVEASLAAIAGSRREMSVDLPPEAEEVRSEIRPLVQQIAAAHGPERRQLFAETRLIAPHWPPPWGRSAGPVEQLVIDQELASAGLYRPNLAVGAWALPTVIAHGTPEQQQRWVGPTLAGEVVWCQLFSEPGAGSDLAALSTRATRDEGGWVIEGQKVWTSMATKADWGICLARSDADAPKHEGITYFIVDMHSEGIEIRPLREITGDAMFNEVFLNGVFVPDDCVVGTVGGGWRLARTTLANERVSMSSGATFGFGIEWILGSLSGTSAAEDRAVLEHLGGLIAEAQSVSLLGARSTLRSVSGVDPGSEASVRKLLGAEHEQRVQEYGLLLLGSEGATTDGEAGRWSHGFLSTRCLTIAGGTSEVQRNVIGERLLGLPRDPEPGS